MSLSCPCLFVDSLSLLFQDFSGAVIIILVSWVGFLALKFQKNREKEVQGWDLDLGTRISLPCFYYPRLARRVRIYRLESLKPTCEKVSADPRFSKQGSTPLGRGVCETKSQKRAFGSLQRISPLRACSVQLCGGSMQKSFWIEWCWRRVSPQDHAWFDLSSQCLPTGSRHRKPSCIGFTVRGGGLRPWSQTMVSEWARPWGRGRSEFANTCQVPVSTLVARFAQIANRFAWGS